VALVEACLHVSFPELTFVRKEFGYVSAGSTVVPIWKFLWVCQDHTGTQTQIQRHTQWLVLTGKPWPCGLASLSTN